MGSVEYLDVAAVQRDKALEDDIHRMRDLMMRATRNDVKQVYASAMADLIRMRSKAQVARMERSRGLD